MRIREMVAELPCAMLKPWVLTVSVGLAAAIAVAQTSPVFTPLQPDLFAAGASFVNAFADIEGDGDLDLFVGFDGQPNRLYRNDAGVFTDIAAASGVADRGRRAPRPGATWTPMAIPTCSSASRRRRAHRCCGSIATTAVSSPT